MKESSVESMEFDTSEWSSATINSIESISGNGILVDDKDGVLIVEGEPVQQVSKESGNWVRSENIDLTPNVLKEPEEREMSLLFICKICERSLMSDIYSNDTSIEKTDKQLQKASFTGYIEVSKDTISGEHYLIYIDGERSCLSVTKGGNIITGQESYDRAEAHVGLYSIYKIELQDVSLDRKQFNSTEKGREYEEETENSEEYQNDEGQTSDEGYDSEQIEENDNLVEAQEGEHKESVEEDTGNIASQSSYLSSDDLIRIEDKLDKIESKIEELSNIRDKRKEESEEKNEYDITDEYDTSEILNNTILSFRYESSSKTLAQCENEDQIKDVLDNIKIVPQTTESVLSDTRDAEVEKYIFQHELFASFKWLLEEYFVNLMNESAPNLPGFVHMIRNLEQVSYNDMFGNKEYDAVFYSREGEATGVLDFYDSQVNVRQIDDSIRKLYSSVGDLEEPFCYIGISKNGYHPGIRNHIEEERYKGGIIRGENRSALMKSDNGTEIHTCLFEQHNGDFFVYYPDGEMDS